MDRLKSLSVKPSLALKVTDKEVVDIQQGVKIHLEGWMRI